MKLDDKRYSQFLIVAPMSSGKSTLINSILGKRLLATSNLVCTSRETKIILNKWLKKNKLYLEMADGSDIVLIDMDDEAVCQYDYNNTDIKNIVIETNGSNQIYSSKVIMIIDTPGENYFGNNYHKLETRKALASFVNGTILYILDASQISSEDNYKILSEVKSSIKGKNITLAFILNKVDSLDPSKENLHDFIRNIVVKLVERAGVSNYIILPCSAEAALLFKCALNNEHLSEYESDKLYKYYKYFYRDTGHSIKYSVFDPCKDDGEETVIYDGECYQKKKLQIALDNTGIIEIENFISSLSTQCKKTKIKTKEK